MHTRHLLTKALGGRELSCGLPDPIVPLASVHLSGPQISHGWLATCSGKNIFTVGQIRKGVNHQ